jgi:hypothetical protein
MHQAKKSFKEETAHSFSTVADCSFAASLRTSIARGRMHHPSRNATS